VLRAVDVNDPTIRVAFATDQFATLPTGAHRLTNRPVPCQNWMQVFDQVFFLGGLGCSPVLVDDSAEDLLPPDRGVEGDHGVRIVAGRVLVEALVWAVVVEVA
jgi:hypothetical protein